MGDQRASLVRPKREQRSPLKRRSVAIRSADTQREPKRRDKSEGTTRRLKRGRKGTDSESTPERSGSTGRPRRARKSRSRKRSRGRKRSRQRTDSREAPRRRGDRDDSRGTSRGRSERRRDRKEERPKE